MLCPGLPVASPPSELPVRATEMKYAIKGKPQGLEIKIEDLGDKQQKVLESLQACAEGKCSCPTSQYEKLDAIQILPSPDSVSIELKAKAGEKVRQSDIEKCLEYTAEQVAKSNSP
jgi:hypothetical protein